MRRANRVDLLLALSSLEGRLAGRKTELVLIDGAWLRTIDDSNLLVAALAVRLALLVVFNITVALGHVGCENFGESVLDLTRGSQFGVVPLDRLQSIDLLAHRVEC